MDSSSESPRYEIKSFVEQKHFENLSARDFLRSWCDVNDSIKPTFLSREEWNNLDTILTEKHPEYGKHFLRIPQDVHLWEMVGIMEAVDKDTFKNNPDKSEKAKKEVLGMGKILKNAGIYIAQRLESVGRGKEIASAMVEEFYGFGEAIIKGERSGEQAKIEEIATEKLSDEETEAVDMFLAGEKFYEARMKKVENGDVEAMRRKTLSQFFEVSERAFELEKKDFDAEKGENRKGLKPWQDNTPFYKAFIDKVNGQIRRDIETPKRELYDSFFRRGMQFLGEKMPFDDLPPEYREEYEHWKKGEMTLREALHIDRLKVDLENTRYFGTTEQISKKETEIAERIQNAIGQYEYKLGVNNPTKMIETQTLNCVGASMLGGALMSEVGLNYLVGDLPGHSTLFLVKSNGQVEWLDMLDVYGLENENLLDEEMERASVKDIVEFSMHPSPEGLVFYSRQESQSQLVFLSAPENGQKVQVLNNLGNTLIREGLFEQAIEVYKQAISLSPKKSFLYSGMGLALSRRGDYKEAIETYRTALRIDPEYGVTYVNLGVALDELGRYEEAIETYRKAIEIDPEISDAYYDLGNVYITLERDEDAVKAYEKYIEIADKENDKEAVESAEQMIAFAQSRMGYNKQ